MKNVKYIKIMNDGKYKNLLLSEFLDEEKEGNEVSKITVVRHVLTSKNPDRVKELDPQTPELSAHRFLQVLFPSLSYKASMELASFLVYEKTELFIV